MDLETRRFHSLGLAIALAIADKHCAIAFILLGAQYLWRKTPSLRTIRMDTLAVEALNSLQAHSSSVDIKLKHLTNLKQEIKHRHCPEAAIPTIFHVIRIALATPHVVDAGFSILGHFTKRLLIQDLHTPLYAHTLKLFPILLERLSDSRERLRQRAIAAFNDFYPISDAARKDVETFMRDTALTNKNPRPKISAMQWVILAHTEQGMLFRAFVPNIVNCLEDADGEVRQKAQATVIRLFSESGMRSKQDLQKRLQERGVRKSIEAHILSELGLSADVRIAQHTEQPPTPASQPKTEIRAEQISTTRPRTSEAPPPEAQPMSIAEQEAAQLTPLYIESSRDLEDTFREMHPWFEGKEAESNWLKREKCIEKLRRIVKGNAPQDYTTLFIANIKSLLDGILKAINSLRTTLCTIGCHLVQDLSRVCGSGMDNMAEILLQNLIKLCGNTKKISASKANDTVVAIMANVSYHLRLLQHIQSATQDKNVQPRTFACTWLKTILTKHGQSKNLIEHSGGVDVIEKIIKSGLNDSNPNVRESMRAVYWVFAKLWSEKSENIMSGLSQSHQDMLTKHSANPHPPPASSNAPAGGKSIFSKSTGAVSTRPSIKEAIAARKRAQAAGKDLPERPGSAAETSTSPVKATAPARPATAMSTSSRHVSSQSVGTLSSAPVRPRRRADNARPTTADGPGGKHSKAETPQGSPAASPAKSRPKTPGLTAGAMKFSSRKVFSPATSPAKSNMAKKTSSADTSPTKAAEDFTMVIPSLNRGVTTNILEDIVSTTQVPSDPYGSNYFPIATADTLTDDVRRMSMNEEMSQPMSHPARGDGRQSFTDMQRSYEDLSQPMSTQALGDGRQSPRKGIERISMSPRNVFGRKETLHPRAVLMQDQRDSRPLKVYEDPVQESSRTSQPTPVTPFAPRVLGELPINEPTSQNRMATDQGFMFDKKNDGKPAHLHHDWTDFKQSEYKAIRKSETIDNPMLARKILESAIVRIQARSLDVHGFRKVQALIPSAPISIWEEGYKLHELLVPLLDYLEAPNKFSDVRDAIRDLDIKTQILVVIKLLMRNQPQFFEPFYPQTLCALVAARKHYHPSTHMVAGLEEIAQDVIVNCGPPSTCISSVLDLLDADRATDTRTMGLDVLKALLHKSHMTRDPSDVERLGQVATTFLESTKPEIRRAALEMVLELRYNVTEEHFWALLANTKNESKGLITYYLARNQAVHEM